MAGTCGLAPCFRRSRMCHVLRVERAHIYRPPVRWRNVRTVVYSAISLGIARDVDHK